MAFADPSNGFQDDSGNICHFMYNVDFAVDSGQGDFDDVLLVQYFLQNIFAHPGAFQSPLPPPPAALVLDGIPGPITGSFIQAFQDWVLNARRYPIVNDGRVDCALPGGNTPIHQAIYTIIHMNFCFMQARPDVDFANVAATAHDSPDGLSYLFCAQTR